MGHRRTGQHAVHGQRQRLLSLLLAVGDGLSHTLDIRILPRHFVSGNVEHLVLGKVLEHAALPLQEQFERIARRTIRQNADYMMAHLAVLDLVVIKESQKVLVLLATVNHLKKIENLLFVLELLVVAVLQRLDAHRLKQGGKGVSHAAFAKRIQTLACRFVGVKGKAHHLREAVIRILPRLPFLVQNLLSVLFVPSLLLFDNISKLTKCDDVLFLELAPHQNSIGRTRQMDRHLNLERLDGIVHFCRAVLVLTVLLGCLVRDIVLGVAKNLSVLSGSCPVMSLINQ